MKHALLAALAGASLVAATGAHAADTQAGEDLLKKNACTACHANDKKMVGPAYKDVAAKYRGQADGAAKLSDKIKKGGAGVWGSMAMPPHPSLSDADLKLMVNHILSLK